MYLHFINIQENSYDERNNGVGQLLVGERAG